jgi:tetratricopeptide (TPR) repeat protein
MKSHLTALLCVLLLGACAQVPGQSAVPVAASDAAEREAEEDSAPARSAQRGMFREADGTSRKVPLPEVELTPSLLYELVAAEIAGQRGASAVSLAKYLELARRTRDPRLAQRAAEIAFFERNNVRALEAAELWYALDPASLDASQTLSGLLINAGRGEEALPHLERLLAADSTNVAEGFLQLNRLLARNSDRKATLSIVQRLAARYPKVPEAQGAVAQAAANAQEDDTAIRAAREASRLKPDWEFPVLLAAQLLSKRSATEASAELISYLGRNPASTEARLALARSLIAEKKYPEALVEFKRVESAAPNNPDVLYALGLLALDSKDFANAEKYLKNVLAHEPRDRNLVYLYLAQVMEEQKRYGEARSWLLQVGRGDQYFNAQSRIAQSLAKEGKIEEGRAHLQTIVALNNQQRVQLVLAEAQLLRDANRNREAFDVLEKSLDKLPNHPDLLYEYAMTAEKIERIDILEANLKKVIQLKPDYAHAYNALGYSLADRNERLVEARDLIEKALKIAPDDAFIIDSMGWVLYRLGELGRAHELLKKAFDARPDAEIAAHLGEVLWKLNRRAEAEKVWRDATARSPDNEILKSTIKRLKP